MNRHERRAQPKDQRPARGMVHFQVADTAKGLAREYWEQSATRSNDFYAIWKDPDSFVDRNWADFISIARSALTSLLADTMTDEKTKEQIYDALLKDQSVNVRRIANPQSKLILPDSTFLTPQENKNGH